jgi:hypothetical protein
VFNVVDQELAAEIEANSRTRGATITFFNNLNEFYADWITDNEGKTFMLALNEKVGDPFHGKKTDSLYQSLMQRINAMELKTAWRLIRKTGDDEVTSLYIVHL